MATKKATKPAAAAAATPKAKQSKVQSQKRKKRDKIKAVRTKIQKLRAAADKETKKLGELMAE